MERKIQKRYTYHGLGFPVVLENVRMVKEDGHWVPEINFNEIEERMAFSVAMKPGRLTGNEVRFLRLHLGYTPQQFALLFDYTRPATIKWEAAGDRATDMRWTTEKDLRLHVMERKGIGAAEFMQAYSSLSTLARRNGGGRKYRISMKGGRISGGSSQPFL
ncbi:hypothetical protein HYR69_06490 [Candidatus Sumerlaeota bacterium]|nr:hypothetical protein [Candidatus Sumerlaeota bacterium]MBI3736699.1 hypothetical protein [Candidatus Sumerlaeota bacterium]